MGCCFSSSYQELETPLKTINYIPEIENKSDESSNNDDPIKIGIIPLLEGPSPLSFESLSSNSDSFEVHLGEIDNLLKQDRIDEAMKALTKEEEESINEIFK